MKESFIGAKLKTLRVASGLNQQKVADFLEIKREMIAYYETGSRNMPLAHIHKICDLFGLEPIDLLDGNKELLQVECMFLGDLTIKDLQPIAQFKKIVRNYISLKKIQASFAIST